MKEKLFVYFFIVALGFYAPFETKAQVVASQTPTVVQSSTPPKPQEINIEVKNERLPVVLKRLEKATGYSILFVYNDLNPYMFNGKIKAANIQQAMDIIIGNKPLEYKIDGKYINITVKEQLRFQQSTKSALDAVAVAPGMILLQGKVVDIDNNPIAGVSVIAKNAKKGTVTGADGGFSFTLTKGIAETLTFTFIGMEEATRAYDCNNSKTDILIMLREDEAQLEEVVVTGMYTHRAESFTGAATTFTKDELLSVGNRNVLESLKNLDPAFQIIESIELGSNPNVMPTVQLRGQTSFPNLQGDYEGNPNQPLFILDGFETDIQKMFDLDMNRIASVTILKDAAAKAIYGSKAGNGVIVIETTRPKSGELKLYYVGDLNIEAPDLTGYNLMNAAEKLEFEKNNYFYTAGGTSGSVSDAAIEQVLKERYKTNYDNILRGVDTYWLSQPLRTGIGQKHSVTLEGGDSRMRYQAGAFYNNVAGVMKGSERNTFNLNTTLSYSYKNLIFRNTLEYTKNDAINSPYGTFSDYAKMNQYYAPKDDKGNYVMILGYLGRVAQQAYLSPVYNPLYNATLNTKSTSYYTEVRDNFGLEWRITDAWRATGRFSYIRQENGSDEFYPANHTKFANYDANGISERKGSYTQGNGYSQSLSADAGINFNKTIDKHLIFMNVTWNMMDYYANASTHYAEGFANDYMDDISFATAYVKNSKPTGSESHTREIGLVGALNYSYDDRYLADFSIRTTGSSMYGSDNRWGLFWSAGAGWNLHKEAFLKGNDWIKQLKLRSSIGYTGTQNFNPYQARARYSYVSTPYLYRLGAELMGLPNYQLQWQQVQDWDAGFDLMLKRFLTVRFDYYVSTTNNLLSDITIPPSTGFISYKENLGKIQNKGLDLTVAITPWRNDPQRAWFTITATALRNSNKILEIYDIFESYNKIKNDQLTGDGTQDNTRTEEENNLRQRPVTLYYEGQSMTAIYGMQSLGIDSNTGEEWFLNKDGSATNQWTADNQVIIGDTQPKIRGTFGLNGGWHGFTFGLTCQYKYGGDLYNYTLVDKVENANGYYNLDRRMFDSWQKPGDVSPYKKMYTNGGYYTMAVQYTSPTSRFVQKDNELYFSSVNLGYDFYSLQTLKRLGVDRLKLSFYMNELLRLSSITVERGTSYPFARNFSFSAQVTF
ncbi:MAG: SusC/RagA family TonB-linked outer membrane protein [Dysgonamonadaceae bacterium]|jgi:TonB-linked SusC/RagA family outer membrane protein|nr:SusC/RagA family TonB-linked outer membrane protein [Dysgonamonadaceae bacterium]